MATIIAKKCMRRGAMSNGQYIRQITDYISSPSSNASPDDNDASKNEKCTALMFMNPYTLDADIIYDKKLIRRRAEHAKRLMLELVNSNSKYIENEKIMSHWVMSFGDAGRQPTVDEAMLAARHLLTDMGYTNDHLCLAAIHSDTGHMHVHIVACRANAMDENASPVKEGNGWWKREGQRFIARECERQPGVFEMEAGTARMVKKSDDGIYEIIKSNTKSGANEIDGAMERRTRKISYDRLLGILLDDAYNKIHERMKWGHFYKELAKYGIFVEARTHGNTTGLTFSLDGKQWRRASQFGERWTIKEISQKITGEFRKPRVKIREIAEEARANHPLDKLVDEYEVVEDTRSQRESYAAMTDDLVLPPLPALAPQPSMTGGLMGDRVHAAIDSMNTRIIVMEARQEAKAYAASPAGMDEMIGGIQLPPLPAMPPEPKMTGGLCNTAAIQKIMATMSETITNMEAHHAKARQPERTPERPEQPVHAAAPTHQPERPAEIPAGNLDTPRRTRAAHDGVRTESAGVAGRSPIVDGRGIRDTAEPADAHERPEGTVGTAGPTGTGDGTPVTPAPDDEAAWNARLIQRMRQSTTTARESALPPAPEPMASPMPTTEPAEISTPEPDDDAAWDALFLERIRRQQATQKAQENMGERPVIPPSPPPHVRKRNIEPQMPEW